MELHYLLMADHSSMQKQIFANIRHLGLTIGQPKVLDYLYNHNGSIQKDIANGCHIEPASLSTILNGMEKKELIVRKIDEQNRRNIHVFMTEKGKETCLIIKEEIEKIERKALLGLSEDEIEHIQIYLEIINKNLEM